MVSWASVGAIQGTAQRVQHYILIDRFGQDAVRVGLERLPDQYSAGVAGNQDHRQVGAAATQDLQRFDACELRHVNIEDRHVDQLGAYDLQRFLAVGGE